MKKGDVFAGDQWTFEWKVMILTRNYSKTWFVGSKGDVFVGDQWTLERKVMLLTRNYSKSWFIGSRSDFCLGWLIANCHWSPAKRIFSFHLRKRVRSFCYTSAAKLVFSMEMFTGPQRNDDLCFTSRMAWATFAIRLQRKCYLACRCSLVCSETMTFFYEKGGWLVFAIILQQERCKFIYLFMARGEIARGNGIQPSQL